MLVPLCHDGQFATVVVLDHMCLGVYLNLIQFKYLFPFIIRKENWSRTPSEL